jgi:hypothetical protein
MLSPVWRAKLCGEIGTSERRMLMDEEDETPFLKVVALGCGKSVSVVNLDDLVGVLRMADRFQVEAIRGDVEEAVTDRLTVENCGPMLTMARGCELVLLERVSRELALRKFDQFAECNGFMDVSEEVLGSLLDDDALVSESEERVLKAAARWMKGGAGGVIRGEGLLRKIRFPFMSAAFLADEVRGILPESAGLEGLTLESNSLKSLPADLWAETELRYLDAKMLTPRHRRGVNWAEYAGGGERRLAAGQWAYSVAVHGRGFVCGGLHDGSIRVWSRSTLKLERTLTGHVRAVWALVSVEGWLISGSDDVGIRVWDVATGRCERTLAGHGDSVRCLAVSGNRLLSGSRDGTTKVWRMEGAVSTWLCERTLRVDGHEGEVNNCMVAWGGKMASGSAGCTIWVWDVLSGAHERTLVGHGGAVRALAVCGKRLISSSVDRTVRVWSMATWACVQTVQAYPAGSAQYIRSLAVSGSALVGGSFSSPHFLGERYEARVWGLGLEGLKPLNTLLQDGGKDVCGLAPSSMGELWGASGDALVVWGWQG